MRHLNVQKWLNSHNEKSINRSFLQQIYFVLLKCKGLNTVRGMYYIVVVKVQFHFLVIDGGVGISEETANGTVRE